jgi:hypothetical protein
MVEADETNSKTIMVPSWYYEENLHTSLRTV